MKRLILLVCVLGLLAGCRKGPEGTGGDKTSSKDGGARPAITKDSAAIDIAKDLLAGSGYANIEVLSSKEHSVTLKKMPAVALHLQWRAKGDSDKKNDLFLIQEQRVKFSTLAPTPYDASKSVEENLAALLKMAEAS